MLLFSGKVISPSPFESRTIVAGFRGNWNLNVSFLCSKAFILMVTILSVLLAFKFPINVNNMIKRRISELFFFHNIYDLFY